MIIVLPPTFFLFMYLNVNGKHGHHNHIYLESKNRYGFYFTKWYLYTGQFMKIILYVKIINIAIYLECSMKYALSLPWNLTIHF